MGQVKRDLTASPPPCDLDPPLQRYRLRRWFTAFPAQLGSEAEQRQVFFNLPRRDLYHVDGVADHVGGTLFPSQTFSSTLANPGKIFEKAKDLARFGPFRASY